MGMHLIGIRLIGVYIMGVSAAPPRLEEAEGRQKRKRRHTDRYEEGVEDGELPESQHGVIGRRG